MPGRVFVDWLIVETAAIATAAEKGAGIVIRGGAAKGAPTEGKQTGLQ
jgi:hypothetical protein